MKPQELTARYLPNCRERANEYINKKLTNGARKTKAAVAYYTEMFVEEHFHEALENILEHYTETIRYYEHESRCSIGEDDRESIEFVRIFLNEKV